MKPLKLRPYPNLRLWRNDRGWSQEQAADFLGMTQAHYSRLERGVVCPPVRRAKVLGEKTGVAVEVLIGLA